METSQREGDSPGSDLVTTAEAGPPPEGEASGPKPAKGGPEPFAIYLARSLVADKGLAPRIVREAAALLEACDITLSYHDGLAFGVTCIVDAETRPERRFGLDDPGALLAIGKACLGYTGSMSGNKLPVHLTIIEVRDHITEDDKHRLERLRRRRPGREKVVITCVLVSPADAEVWSSAPFRFFAERYYRKLLAAPRRSAEDLTAGPEIGMRAGFPWLTAGIIAVCAALFVAEIALGVTPTTGLLSPSVDTLVALGGASRDLVREGEWYRLFTATLLHADPIHLLFNAVGLFFGGVVLEGLLGRAWLLSFFVVGALGGSIASITFNDPNIVSVGASGAIMGLLAAGIVVITRLPPASRAQMQMPLLQMLVPSLLPFAVHSGEHIDLSAHIGGALTGALAGVGLLAAWPKRSPHPRFRGLALAVALAGLVAYVGAFALMSRAYAGYQDIAAVTLIPNEDLKSLSDADGPDLVAKYPRDPRARFFAAIHDAKAGNTAGAEAHLRAGLAEQGVLRRAFKDRKLEIAMRAFLARMLEDEGRHPQALEAARPACDAKSEELRAFCP